jgi:hypothetical protein
MMIERTHNMRMIQVITRRTANTSTKIVGVSGTNTMEVGASTKNILIEIVEWGFRNEGINKISVRL